MTNDSPASRRFQSLRFRDAGKFCRQISVGLLLIIVIAATGCGVSRSDLGEIVTELPQAPAQKNSSGGQAKEADNSVSAPSKPAAASSPTESPAK